MFNAGRNGADKIKLAGLPLSLIMLGYNKTKNVQSVSFPLLRYREAHKRTITIRLDKNALCCATLAIQA